MKRLFSTFMIIICILCGTVFFSGCSNASPIVFHSILSINNDESGSRTITAAASQSTINALFNGKLNSFQSFISVNCPESITWDCSETGNFYNLTFTISFSGLDEYQSIVGELTGVTDSVAVSRPQAGVKTGFTLDESTDTISLFSWLSSALIERTGISQSKISSLMLNGTNELVYAGRSYEQAESGLHVYVETLLDAERIDILTDLALDNIWNRTVQIRFPDAMLENAVNVKPYLTSLLPEGITEAWTDDTTWTLTFPASGLQELGQLMNGLFQSQESDTLTETITADNSMHFVHHYEEPLNLDFFVPNTGKTLVRYYVKNTADATLLIPDGDSQTEASSLDGTYPDYICLYNQSMSGGRFDFTASYQYQPLEIIVDTTVLSSQDIRRTTTFEMGCLLPDIHRNLMLETLSLQTKGYGSVSADSSNGMSRIVYTQSGTEENINSGFTAVFGKESAFSYQRNEPAFLSHQLKASYSDSIDLTGFLVSPEETLLTYCLSFPGRETLEDGTGTLTALFTGGSCELSGRTSRPNGLRPWLIALAAAVGLLLLYLFLAGPVRFFVTNYQKNKRRQISRKYPQKKSRTNRSGSGQTTGRGKTSRTGQSPRGGSTSRSGKAARSGGAARSGKTSGKVL